MRSTTASVCSCSIRSPCHSEIEELAASRETAIVLTAPWHERDTQALVERLGVPVFAPPSESAEDLMRKYGISREQAGDGSPDLAWLRTGDVGVAHWYSAGDRPLAGVEAFPSRDTNEVVLWVEDYRAVIAGDTLVDFGRGLEIPLEWLRGRDAGAGRRGTSPAARAACRARARHARRADRSGRPRARARVSD